MALVHKRKLTLGMPEEVVQDLKWLAIKRNVSASVLTEQILREYFEKNKEELKKD